MYYKEQIVNGILCYKNTPDGEWIEKTKEQLTKKITQLKVDMARLQNRLDIATRRVHEPI